MMGEEATTNLVECEILQKRCSSGVSVEDSKHLLSSVGKELLSIARVGDRLALLCVAKQEISKRSEIEGSATHFNLICRKLTFGMSRTKIHRTLKTPFHLSEAQTVLLLV